MPTLLAVVTTESSIDLIDVTNDKLWMRFIQGTNNVMGATSANVRARRVAWYNGLAFVAYGNESTDTEGGAGIWINFAMDTVRWTRSLVSTTTGSYYRGALRRTAGAISVRNSATGGYSGDYNDWSQPDNRTYDVALWYSSGYLYWAAATLDGLTVFKWQYNYLQNSPEIENADTNEITHMRWCYLDASDGELFYMDTTKMYSKTKAGYELVMDGGSFSRDTEKTLPGTRSSVDQYIAVPYGSYFFVPTNEGIYRVDWPSGSFTLFYGVTGSGATHEILPGSRPQVNTLATAVDGATDVLLVGLTHQTAVIKLSDNTFYARTRVLTGHTPAAVAA
jgi:hypothetical protein